MLKISKILYKTDKNVLSLQLLQMLRAATVFIISIFLAKIFDDTSVISKYENLILIGSSLTFFWVSGIVTTFLPFYYSNNDSKIIFNTFSILSIFSVLAFSMILIIGKTVYPELPLNLVLWYSLFILFNSPSLLLEYVFLIKGHNKWIGIYASIVLILQTLAVIIPLYYGYGLLVSIKMLALLGFLKFIFSLIYFTKICVCKIDKGLIKLHLNKAWPIIASFLLGGSAEYIDAYIVTFFASSHDFALFRYGARELPLTMMFATALSNVVSGNIAKENLKNPSLSDSFEKLKASSKRLMHILFPLTVILLVFSPYLYKYVYSDIFVDAYRIFNVYLLLIVSRLVFPHTILLGLQKNKIIFWLSVAVLIVNTGLSILFINIFGIVGVAYATLIVHYLYKLYLIIYNHQKGFKINQYTNTSLWITYSALCIVIYFLI